MDTFGATFSGSDMPGLLRAAIQFASYARGVPERLDSKLVERTPVADWAERAIANQEQATARWGEMQSIGWNIDTVSAKFPDVALDAEAVAKHIAKLPFELAVFSITDDLMGQAYQAPAISAGHALLGWGAALKGAGHESSVVSRRWLEHGPWRTVRGPEDTTVLQFYDLQASAAEQKRQTEPAHEAFVAGYLRPKHRSEHDIKGIYTPEDRLLRVVVAGRDVSASEMRDACAARRDNRHDARKPIANVAFIFMDRESAQRHLHDLWLHGLECRAVDNGVEQRLDAEYQPSPRKPAWAEAVERR